MLKECDATVLNKENGIGRLVHSFHTNSLGKGMNLSFVCLAIGKIAKQT